MSGRVRKQSGEPASKAGPMRATLPVSSVLKQGAPRKNSGHSPTLSPPNVWRRISPDHALSGQRSPGALNYKGKSRYGCSVIRRTASLDTLYHKGQWPRDFYLHAGHLQVDKATQTEDGGGSGGSSGRSSRGADDDKLERFLRSRLQRPHKPSAEHSSQTMSPGFWSRFGSTGGPLRAARSSVEGLNQEIERLVLCPASGTQTPLLDRVRDKVTPEGHRAPLAELFRRSVNTQTPLDLCHTAPSSGPPSHESISSSGSPDLLRVPSGGSVCSSPDIEGNRFGTSPQINRFLAREPPDGCEKVSLKAGEGAAAGEVMVIKPTVLRPSLGSAFQPLQPTVSADRSPAPYAK